MSILMQTKIDFETYFKDNWSVTEVHWSGIKWDTSAHDEWVYFEYMGSSVGDYGISSEIVTTGQINITCVATNRLRVHELADEAITLLHGKRIANNFVNSVRILAQGLLEESNNKSFMDLSFEVSTV